MDHRAPLKDVDGVFRSINRMSGEAEWHREELRDEINASGLDADRLVDNVKARVSQMLSKSEDEILLLPLLNELKRRTRLSASEIALRLGVPLAFLSAMERYANLIPFGWRSELANRAERSLQISGEILLATFEVPTHPPVAALRDPSLQHEKLNYEKILEEAGMDEAMIQFWLSLASEPFS